MNKLLLLLPVLLLILPACDAIEKEKLKNIRLDNEIKEHKLRLLKKISDTCCNIPIELVLEDDSRCCLGVQMDEQGHKSSSHSGAVAHQTVRNNAQRTRAMR